MTDPFDLQRFLDVQSSVYPLVLDELRRGRKQSHWQNLRRAMDCVSRRKFMKGAVRRPPQICNPST
jgi:uncharacterized protein (DUF1810 family)